MIMLHTIHKYKYINERDWKKSLQLVQNPLPESPQYSAVALIAKCDYHSNVTTKKSDYQTDTETDTRTETEQSDPLSYFALLL